MSDVTPVNYLKYVYKIFCPLLFEIPYFFMFHGSITNSSVIKSVHSLLDCNVYKIVQQNLILMFFYEIEKH